MGTWHFKKNLIRHQASCVLGLLGTKTNVLKVRGAVCVQELESHSSELSLRGKRADPHASRVILSLELLLLITGVEP